MGRRDRGATADNNRDVHDKYRTTTDDSYRLTDIDDDYGTTDDNGRTTSQDLNFVTADNHDDNRYGDYYYDNNTDPENNHDNNNNDKDPSHHYGHTDYTFRFADNKINTTDFGFRLTDDEGSSKYHDTNSSPGPCVGTGLTRKQVIIRTNTMSTPYRISRPESIVGRG